MIDSRFAIVQYCDDIRQEVGNKYSLMGCYGTDLIVNEFPAILPKLCARIQILTPLDRPFSALTIRAELNGEVISEAEVDTDQLTLSRKNTDQNNDARDTMVVIMMNFTPLPVDEPCKLRISVETEDETLQGNTLHLRATG